MQSEPFSLFAVQPHDFLKCHSKSNDTIPFTRGVWGSNRLQFNWESAYNSPQSKKPYQSWKNKTRYRRPHKHGMASRALSWRNSSSSEQTWKKNNI